MAKDSATENLYDPRRGGQAIRIDDVKNGGTLRIGTDDAENPSRFLEPKISG
jgi:hypothetical protein